MSNEIKLPTLDPIIYTVKDGLALANLMQAYAKSAVELNTPRHTEAEVQEIFDATDKDKIHLHAPTVRRILGVPKP
jgi:hypothetical protein